ncbi:Cyb5d2, partial [Symbiodinium necroappetens]
MAAAWLYPGPRVLLLLVGAASAAGHEEAGTAAEPIQLYVDGLPKKTSSDPSCKAHPGCEHLAGNCCPTWDGLNLGCCFSWHSPLPTPPNYVDVADSSVPGPGGPYRQAIMRDPFSGVLEAETMQPIYLLPVTNGLKQIVVFFVFGFDLKFKPNSGTWKKKLIKWLASSLFRVIFIGLAANAFRLDVQKFLTRNKAESSRYNEVMIAMAVWCISPNFTMGLGIWNQLRLQSPGAVFRDDIAESRYYQLWTPHIYRDVRFPFCPGGARWLTIAKQVYALVLLPYVIPVMFLEVLMSVLFCYWIVFKSRLFCLVKCIQVHMITLGCCLIWLLTAGHYGAEKIHKYWTTLWPFVYMYLVYIFASFVVPVLMAAFYGILIGSHWFQIWKGIGLFQESKRKTYGLLHKGARRALNIAPESGSETSDGEEAPSYIEEWYYFIMPHRELQLELDDRTLLIRLDENRLSKDFKFNVREDHTLGVRGVKIVEALLLRLREQMESDSEDDAGLNRGCFDVLVGEETCQDGDINIQNDPTLKHDLQDKKDRKESLHDSEVQIVMLTIKSLAEAAIVQAVTIFLVRTLTGETFSDFVNAMNITIQERHILDWIHHLAKLGEEKLGKALHTVRQLAAEAQKTLARRARDSGREGSQEGRQQRSAAAYFCARTYLDMFSDEEKGEKWLKRTISLEADFLYARVALIQLLFRQQRHLEAYNEAVASESLDPPKLRLFM